MSQDNLIHPMPNIFAKWFESVKVERRRCGLQFIQWKFPIFPVCRDHARKLKLPRQRPATPHSPESSSSTRPKRKQKQITNNYDRYVLPIRCVLGKWRSWPVDLSATTAWTTPLHVDVWRPLENHAWRRHFGVPFKLISSPRILTRCPLVTAKRYVN